MYEKKTICNLSNYVFSTKLVTTLTSHLEEIQIVDPVIKELCLWGKLSGENDYKTNIAGYLNLNMKCNWTI